MTEKKLVENKNIVKWKIRCLALAECFDAWRVVPRIMLILYGWFVYEVTQDILSWYMTLPSPERTLETGGIAVGIFTAITGLGTLFLNAYVNSGRKWKTE